MQGEYGECVFESLRAGYQAIRGRQRRVGGMGFELELTVLKGIGAKVTLPVTEVVEDADKQGDMMAVVKPRGDNKYTGFKGRWNSGYRRVGRGRFLYLMKPGIETWACCIVNPITGLYTRCQ